MLGSFLWAIIIIIVVLWLLGHFAFAVTGTLFNLILLIAFIALIVWLFDTFSGRRP